jgi:hypothetical protein
VRCHLGDVPQERTAEEHTTRGRCTTLATSGREILGGMVSRGWSLWTVPCEGGMYLARTLTTNGSQPRSSTSFSLESTAVDVFDCSARWRSLCPMARSARSMFAGEPPSSSEPTKRPSTKTALFSTGFVGSSCRSAARTSRARIALCNRLLRRRSGTKKHVSPSSSAQRRAIRV